MSENDKQDDETRPVRPEGAADLPPAPAAAESPTTDGSTAATPAAAAVPASAAGTGRRGFRERFRSLRASDGNRTYGLAALIASALAGIIVGGLGIATFQAVTDDHDRDRGPWMQRRDTDGDEGFGGWGGMHGGPPGGPPGVPGQAPPTTPPEDEGGEG